MLPPRAETSCFASGAQEALVDAVAIDKKGAFQRNLTQKDFHVFEDGKEQKITSFSLESAGIPGHSPKHFIALVFECEEPGLRDRVMQFVDRFASPDLYLAVFSKVDGQMRLQQAFTTDPVKIKAAVRSMPEAVAPSRDPKHPNQTILDVFLDRISSVATALAPVRGRKAMVFLSYGFSGTRPAPVPGPDGVARRGPGAGEKIRKTAADCNTANVSMYAFEMGPDPGVSTGNYYDLPSRIEDDHGGQTDFVHDLTVFTGGKYTPPGTYDLASFLGTISADQSDYYLLGFTPSGDSADKPCHKLKVKVDRSGLDIDARDTFCTTGQPPRALTPAQKALEARAAAGAGNLDAGLQVTWFHSRRNDTIVDVAMDIDPHAMKLRGRHAELILVGTAVREDGSVAARIPDTVKLDFETLSDLDTFLRSPYHYSKQFTLPPGPYNFRMVVGGADEAFGTAEKPLDIEAWTGKMLSASSLALSDSDYPISDVTAFLDNSVLEGPYRLASKGREVVPMGGAEFPAGRDGVFYFEIYDPQLAQGTSTPPTMRLRLLDRATGQEKNDSSGQNASAWMQKGNPVIPIALALPISKLPRGSYTLEERITRDGGAAAVIRTADFVVK